MQSGVLSPQSDMITYSASKVALGDGKMAEWKVVCSSSSVRTPKKANAKEYSNYCTIALYSHASKVMLKILEAVCELRTSRCTSWI